MQVSTKANIVAFFNAIEAQAAFDGDGNAEAMIRGIRMDVESTKPDTAFDLRPTFEGGAEQEARRIDNMTPSQEMLDRQAAESKAAADQRLIDEAAAVELASRQNQPDPVLPLPDPAPPAAAEPQPVAGSQVDAAASAAAGSPAMQPNGDQAAAAVGAVDANAAAEVKPKPGTVIATGVDPSIPVGVAEDLLQKSGGQTVNVSPEGVATVAPLQSDQHEVEQDERLKRLEDTAKTQGIAATFAPKKD